MYKPSNFSKVVLQSVLLGCVITFTPRAFRSSLCIIRFLPDLHKSHQFLEFFLRNDAAAGLEELVLFRLSVTVENWE